MTSALWPYLAVVLFGFLPSEVWRLAAVFLSRRLDMGSPILHWVRLVATALLAGLVAKLLVTPSGALAAAPALARFGALAVGLVVFALARRHLMVGVIAGEAVLIGAVWWWG